MRPGGTRAALQGHRRSGAPGAHTWVCEEGPGQGAQGSSGLGRLGKSALSGVMWRLLRTKQWD